MIQARHAHKLYALRRFARTGWDGHCRCGWTAYAWTKRELSDEYRKHKAEKA